MKKLTHIFKNETRKIFRVFLSPTFIYLTLLGNGLLFIATVAVYYLEKDNPNTQIHTYFDALWWGVSTITTIGYGDLLPQTFPGRLIGIFLMYTGTVLFISFTGILLSALLKEEVEEEIAPLKKEVDLEEKKQEKMEKTLELLVKRFEQIEKKLSKPS